MLSKVTFKKLGLVVMSLLMVIITLALPLSPCVLAATVPDQGISLQISPLPIDLETKPGSSTTTELRVRNAGTQTEKLQVRILKVSADDNGIVHLSQPEATDSFVNWIHFDKTVFNAPSNQWQTINMTVDVPSSAAFGYYWAVEYLRADDQAPQPGKAVARGAVATFILLNANAPGAKRQAQIVSFSADRKSYEFLPASFTVKMRNTGNVHVAPSGNIFITRGGKQISAIDINATGGNILPDSSRFFSSSWNDGFPVYVTKYNGQTPAVDKNGKPTSTLKWDFAKANHLRFGHYTAKLVMVYDDGTRDVPLEASVSFWVVPWRLVIGFIVVALFVGIGLWSTFKKWSGFIKKRIRTSK
jgi:hypothetical protein